ncbi:MAG: TetR/AcrR family transcriptional regulator [Pelatocladus maniniholoensis HA4357-MV3]|jgi:TetR/AcrR family transcriptional repressor of nem operon|uniref:TetR/AcrR family transcriptional regulator n=1 Tax=Pelatocladus maniniholoensis HA4357-MV3 TaxID=1117104 RepID=A0A9E3LRV4_9NOST|nr:TetR/AcrR family transcriptional regulator [Pelatocladus maniniholoensis HA4357-MV3]
MRYKDEHKIETHRRIVEFASKEFRTHGFEGVGIAKLMGKLDLTHGGFYAHFANKEALIAESFALALNQSLDTVLVALEVGGFPALLDFYLSENHRDHPALGCPLPALSAEVARRSLSTRKAFTEKLSEVFDAIAEHLPETTYSQKRAKVSFISAAMVGAMSLARAAAEPSLSKAILESTHEYLLTLVKEELS